MFGFCCTLYCTPESFSLGKGGSVPLWEIWLKQSSAIQPMWEFLKFCCIPYILFSKCENSIYSHHFPSFSHRRLGCFPLRKAGCNRVMLPNLPMNFCCFVACFILLTETFPCARYFSCGKFGSVSLRCMGSLTCVKLLHSGPWGFGPHIQTTGY